MIKIKDGRTELYQWDTGSVVTVGDGIDEVHFARSPMGRSITVPVANGEARVEDVLLQSAGKLFVWGFVGTAEDGYTKLEREFTVRARNKPANYVFTPPEQITMAEILEELKRVQGVVTPEAVGALVEEYLRENPVDGAVQIDDTLTKQGYAADAKAVGDALKEINTSGAEVTAESIKTALGYTPADDEDIVELSEAKANLTAVPNAASVDGKTLKMQRTTTTTAEDGTETTETKDLFNVELPEGGGEDVVRKTGWNPNKYLGTNEDGVVVEKPAPDGTGGEITEEVTKLKNRLFKVDGDLCVEFEQGGLSGSDYKTENTSMYWIRSTEYIKREYIKSASVNDGYRMWSYHYDANMNYVGINNNGIASPVIAGVYVRVAITRNDGITPESDHGFTIASTVNDFGKQIETANDEARMANCVVEMEQGSIAHVGAYENNAAHYIRNKGFIPYNSAYKITANPDYSGYVFLFDEKKQPINVIGGVSYCAKLPVGFGEYEIPYNENAAYVRFTIQNSTQTAITPTDNHGVRLHGASRYRYERDRIVRNFLEQIKYQMPIVPACVGTTSAEYFKTDIGAVCITDLHGALRSLDDAYQVRENIASYNMGGDLPILNAGDMFPGVAKENGAMVSAYDEYIEKAVAYGVYHTMGQHEVGFYDTEEGRSKARCLTHDEVFEKFISPMKDVWELPDLTTNYYCKDFVASKTRLISLYQYNIPLVEETSNVWKYPRAAVWYRQEQLDWLVNTLSSTPDGYRVIVLMHQPEKDIVRSDKGGFFTGESVGGGNIIIDGTPIVDILDAYATRTSLSKTYVCKDKTRYPESDFSNTVNADFSASKGLFCNYITGDAHVDYIGVVKGTEQNNIGLTSSGQCYDAVILSRDYGTTTYFGNNPESSIVTVLGYDHNRRMIRIGRLGQQFASDGSTRMYTAISY
jgi:hypothetical protein